MNAHEGGCTAQSLKRNYMVTAPSAPQHLVRRAVEEIWNDEQLAVADEIFASTYINHGGLITDLVQGPEAIKTSVVLYRRAFPELHLTIDELTCVGSTSELHWSARSAHPGVRFESTQSGGTDALVGVTWTQEAHGQIQESWTEWNQADVLRRLGLMASPEAMHASGPV